MRVNTLTFQFEEKGTPERTFDLQIFLDSAFRFFRQIAKLYIYNKTAVNVRMFVYLQLSSWNRDTPSCMEVMRIASFHIVCGILNLSPRKRQT